ncbi:hypothetical protein [Asticcacaulis sp. YBE204]|uniref:hypothetical protein n=1 Tax=Asticcacaulis sp. YBE204 TaxID=1282363 RepID=UPI0003C3DEFE|nr:hypothetical protein [Asticcacaulis sp. YBE204]ESQ79945.1 hypothetical protein AEYBE204_08850 [Asticcacaulis sp. YBE204]
MFRIISLACLIAAFALPASAQDSLENTSRASGNSAEATAQLSGAGVLVAVGSVALPVIMVGASAESAGEAIRDSGETAWDEANKPLPVSKEVVVAQAAPDVPYDVQKPAKPAPKKAQ